MKVRSCFAGLASGFRVHLTEGSETRELFDYHRGRIEALFASQPDLPLHQDTVAGFVQGFLMTAAYFVPDDSVEQQSMFPVLGGALLVGQDLPIETSPANVAAGRGFFERAALALADATDDSGYPSVLYELVQRAFDLVPDVPMSCASLGGFCLGALYANPYLSDFGADQVALLISAACQHARDLPQPQ